jgi:hypothetical protein
MSGKAALLTIAAMLLSGCLGAVAIPLITTAGVTAATSTSVDRTVSYAERTTRMNCRQLRSEYARLQRDALGRANPLGGWAGRRAAIVSAASNRGCSLSN